MIEGCRLLRLQLKGDERGSLVALDQGEIPFPIARVYYAFETKPGVTRGRHAHRRLQQVAVAVNGACTMVLDNGRARTSVHLDAPDKGVFIGPMIWREMEDFSDNCILLVLASEPYDESDYIRDYTTFQGEARERLA